MQRSSHTCPNSRPTSFQCMRQNDDHHSSIRHWTYSTRKCHVQRWRACMAAPAGRGTSGVASRWADSSGSARRGSDTSDSTGTPSGGAFGRPGTCRIRVTVNLCVTGGVDVARGTGTALLGPVQYGYNQAGVYTSSWSGPDPGPGKGQGLGQRRVHSACIVCRGRHVWTGCRLEVWRNELPLGVKAAERACSKSRMG